MALTAAGSALVANSLNLKQEVHMAQQPNNAALPDIIRVEALKGFRARVGGRMEIVNPGDVVDVEKETAVDLRMAHKAVMTEKDLKRQSSYLPERKRAALKAGK